MTTRDSGGKDVSWKIRGFWPADLPQIISLLEVCFKEDLTDEKRTIEHWKWEFVDVPEGPSEIFVAEDHGKIIGHYACIPMIFSTPSGDISSRLAVDAMTHPDYLKQGIFTELGLFSMNALREIGCSFALGFVATGRKEQVMPGHLKVGWFPIVDIPVLGRPLNPSRVAGVRFGNRILAKIAGWGLAFVLGFIRPWKPTIIEDNVVIRKIESHTPMFNDLWRKIRSRYHFIQHRDQRFIKWRFFSSPHREYEVFVAEIEGTISGYAVVRNFSYRDLNGCLLIDLVAENQYARELLIDEALRMSENAGADILACMILDHQSMDSLRKKGFMNTGEAYTLIVYPISDQIHRSDVENHRNWFLTWADFDVL